MLSCIPSYRLPREVLQKEISAIIEGNVALKCGVTFGSDITIDDIFGQGFQAIFIATGAHKSLQLNVEGENSFGIYSAMQFLKELNLSGKTLGNGHVGIIGGGNSAVDASRVANRQKGIESVTIFYRRTSKEMPAFDEEIEDAVAEGIKLETLISPVKIHSRDGHLISVDFILNELGDFDSTGRRKPIAVPGTKRTIPLNTLIVGIGEQPDTEHIASMGINTNSNKTLKIDSETLSTNHPGVFAGGDIVSGSSTVVDAIAAGKKAASMIDLYVRSKELEIPTVARLPKIYIEPVEIGEAENINAKRINPPKLSVDLRRNNFAEVEKCFTAEQAICEARRCLRCDLEFIHMKNEGDTEKTAIGEKHT